MKDVIVKFFVVFTILTCIKVTSSQNCTGNQFISNGVCQNCGANSYASRDFSTCPCIEASDGLPYIRYFDESTNYKKQCFKTPGKPVNVSFHSVKATSTSITWQPPSVTDSILKTSYEIGELTKCRIIAGTQKCTLSIWNDNEPIAITSYSKIDLIPFTRYNVMVCSFNDATKSRKPPVRSCSNHVSFTTAKQAPPALPKQDFTFQKNLKSKKIIIHFGKPAYFGSDVIKIHLKCDKLEWINQTFTLSNISQSTFQMDEPCVNLLPCSIQASNEVGFGNKTTKIFQLNANCKTEEDNSLKIEVIIAIVLVCLLGTFLLVGGLIFWNWRRIQLQKEKRWKEQLMMADLTAQSTVLPFQPRNVYVDAVHVQEIVTSSFANGTFAAYDDVDESIYEKKIDPNYDYPLEKLNVIKKLGEGNFACVYKAEADSIISDGVTSAVAVKYLKDSVDAKDKEDFQAELDLMKKLDAHPNVVQLLGCCKGKEITAMIVEFLACGDLLDLLRRSRETDNKKDVPCTFLSEQDFINFSYDVACGMAHIAAANIVHRDLACRNVLVTGSGVCKVADLGLARNLDEDGIFLREKHAKLPIKWMSPESLRNGVCSTKSDVWSFGIVLWEIVTIGASPYPGYKSKDVVELLLKMYRMPKPSHCNDALYDIMCSCWEEEATQRPEFSTLKKQFYHMKTADDTTYLNLDDYCESSYTTFDNQDDDVVIDAVEDVKKPMY